MLSKEDFLVIQAVRRRGVYLRDIAEELGVHSKTVSRALKRGGPPGESRRRRVSKLDPYRSLVDQLLRAGVWNAVVINRELEQRGYRGKISILRGAAGLISSVVLNAAVSGCREWFQVHDLEQDRERTKTLERKVKELENQLARRPPLRRM